MTQTSDRQLEATTEIAAPPQRVWDLVGDLRNMARWSPQVLKSFVRGAVMRRGAQVININHRGLLVWPTRAEVVDYEPSRELAFRIKDNYTVWRYLLEPTAVGTRLTVRRETPHGISTVSTRLVDTVLGGQQTFTAELLQGMEQTLAQIKHDAEAS